MAKKEYIERETVIAKSFSTGLCDSFGDMYGGGDVVLVNEIKQIPAADVEEVVRCKYCGNYCKNTGECNMFGHHPDEDGYCSKAVKNKEL